MTIFALLFIDRWGRRWPLLIGGILMMIWMYANAGLLASYGSPAPPGGVDNVSEESWQISGAPAKAVIACTYLFVASYAPTWGPVSVRVSLESTCFSLRKAAGLKQESFV